MFKKKPTIKALAPLRSSDRRKLADQIIEDYHLISASANTRPDATDEEKADAVAARTALRNAILPENVQAARFTTTVGPELKPASGMFYVGGQEGEDARILWFQIHDRTYPSLYTVWKSPDIVPLLHTPEIVVKKLQGGADLMTPGLAGGPPFSTRAVQGAIVAVASTSRPTVPMAVGTCEIDISQLQQVQGAKGHAVQNMHWVEDELWNYSPANKPGQQVPDEIDGWVKVLESQGLVEKAEDLTLDDQDGDGGIPLAEEPKKTESTADGMQTSEAGIEQHDSAPSQSKEFSQKEVDEAFRNAFLYGVHHHKTTNSDQKNFGIVFPISQSNVMSSLVQPFLPAFNPEESQQLQIKKTSWKNIRKFIKSLDKARIVKSKDQDGNQTVILDIDFDDSAIVNFKPYRLPKKEAVQASQPAKPSDTATDRTDAGDDSIGQRLRIHNSYKPSSKQQALFEAAAGSRSFYSANEVRVLVANYVEGEGLVSETNKRMVKLNPVLANSVFDGSAALDKEVIAKGIVPRDALIDRVLSGMAASHSILKNGANADSVKAKSGAAPKVLITLETRSGNKTVTKVSGLEAFHVNPRPLADELRKVCAGSTSVEPLAGAAKKNEKEVMEVMIQGPQKDAVVKALEKRGVDKRWVEVLDKTKGKKR